MCVCISVRHAVNQSSRLSNSAHYSPPLIFPKSSQSEALPLLHSHFGSLMRQFSTCTYTHTHAKKAKQKPCNTSRHNRTQQSTPLKFHKEAVKGKEVDQPVAFFFFAFLLRLFFLGVYTRWIPKRKQSWDGDKLRRSQSPPQRQRVAGRTTGKEAGREAGTRSSLIDTANRGKEFQMGGITGSIVWLAETL